MRLEVTPIAALRDNYIYLLRSKTNVAVVDPGEARPVLRYLRDHSCRLDEIWVTHHHWDHTDGISELVRETGCKVRGSHSSDSRRLTLDIKLEDNEGFPFGGTNVRVLAIPGHTLGHIAYWFEREKIVFTGDTLFNFGCGRLFEGTVKQMWKSFCRLRQLPDETQIYCGHEYTQHNLRFALSLAPANHELRAELAMVRALRERNEPTVPCRMGDQKRLNPFLTAENASRFGEIRKLKDEWKG